MAAAARLLVRPRRRPAARDLRRLSAARTTATCSTTCSSRRTKATFPSYTLLLRHRRARPRSGADTCLAWDPSYFDPAGSPRWSARTGAGREIDLLNNKLKTPYSDQFSLGMRNRIGRWNTEVTFSHVRSRDGFVFLLGNRRPDGSFFASGAIWNPPFGFPVPGFGSLILGTNGLRDARQRGVHEGRSTLHGRIGLGCRPRLQLHRREGEPAVRRTLSRSTIPRSPTTDGSRPAA